MALGSNLGESRRILAAVRGRLGAELLSEIRVSDLYGSLPVGGPDQPPYRNAVIVGESDRSPEEILTCLLRLEAEAGRVRTVRWGPRTLDLDLVAVAGEERDSPTLTLPHPRARERLFVLAPLVEVWPECPLGGGTAAHWYRLRRGDGGVWRLRGPEEGWDAQ